MLLKKGPNLDSIPPVQSPLESSRSSTRERKQRVELDFSPADSEDDEVDFQPAPKTTKKRSAVVIEDSSESDFSEDDEEIKKPVNKKSRIPLKPLSSNNRRSSLVNKIPIGKFLPLKSRVVPNNDARSTLIKKFKVPTIQAKTDEQRKITPKAAKVAAVATAAIQASTNSNFGERKTLGLKRRMGPPRALYDHTAEDAIVLWDPDQVPVEEEELKITTDKPKKKGKSLSEILGIEKEEKKLVHVVVDPVLGRVLRPHQVEGVKFLYKCTTGQVYPDAYG
jgi:DNA repair and recombination RAD54-like protein